MLSNRKGRLPGVAAVRNESRAALLFCHCTYGRMLTKKLLLLLVRLMLPVADLIIPVA